MPKRPVDKGATSSAKELLTPCLWHFSRMTGTIPLKLRSLWRLVILDLSHNSIKGEHPLVWGCVLENNIRV